MGGSGKQPNGTAIALLPKQTAIGIRLRLDCCLEVGNCQNALQNFLPPCPGSNHKGWVQVHVCQGTCHSLGRATGTCGTYGCTCSDRFLTPSEFLLCAAESTCRLDCQAKGHATGQCDGWACNCS